jgi:hypothetical protein
MAKIDPDEPCPCGSGKLYRDCHQAQTELPAIVSEHVALTIMPEPDPGTRSVFQRVGEGTVFFAGRATQTSFDCGKCHTALMVGVVLEQAGGAVLRCPNCGAFNDTQSAAPQTNKQGPENNAPKTRFEDRVVRMADLAGESGLVDSVTFVGCDVKGPAVLVPQGCTLTNCNLGGPSADAILWEVPASRTVIVGAILAKNCVFERCHFFNVGFAGPPELIRQIRDNLP